MHRTGGGSANGATQVNAFERAFHRAVGGNGIATAPHGAVGGQQARRGHLAASFGIARHFVGH
eukprot:3569399-Pyramimonas_sp.AAC.1